MERKLIAAAVTSALAVPMAAQAVEFAVSGHVNRAVILIDQDNHAKDGDLQHVDSNASETRFRFKGTEDLDGGLSVGANLELGKPSAWRTRHANVSLGSAAGKLTIGQTDAAVAGAEDAGGAFNGGTWLAGVSNWCAYYSAGPACATDGVSRLEVLRYDTPSLGPAKISVSTGNNEYYDAKLTIAGSMGEAGYDFRAGYWKQDDVADADAILTSGAISFGQGTSLGVAWVKRDGSIKRGEDGAWGNAVAQAAEEIDDSAVYAFLNAVTSASLETETFFATADHSVGDASFGVYWRKGEHTLSARSTTGMTGSGGWDANLWGLGLSYNIGGGATAYAGYRHIEKDDVELAEDTNLFLTGMRVTFN